MAAKKLFYSMGEVSEMFDVNPSLIRHWESKFDCIRPHKNKKGNRMFSPEDVQMLKQIYHLVKERGMTLEGANKVMRSSRKELSRDTELLERLQRIRSALVEVREELKAGDDEQLVESAGAEMEEAETVDMSVACGQREDMPDAGTVECAPASGGKAAGDAAEPEAGDRVAEEPVAEQSESDGRVAVAAREAEVPAAVATVGPDCPAAGAEGEPAAGEAVAAGDAAAEQPKKRVRRRRKSDDDNNKELFPFYEQSLF